MRLLIVSQPTSGGVAVCVRDQIGAGVGAGYEVEVISPGSESGPLADWAREAGAKHHEMGLRRKPEFSDVFHLFKLMKAMARADVVHLHSSKAGALGRTASFLIRRRYRPPIVFTPHAWSWLVGGRMAGMYKLVERALLGRSDRIIAVSQAEAAEGMKVLGGNARITVIHNGVDLSQFTPVGPAAQRSTDPLVVCIGRLAHQKGQDIAIRSMVRWMTETARLRLVGSGHDEPELKALAEAMGVADRIEWVEATPAPAPHLRAADVVLIPSRWDGLSLVLLEALATGSAIVATSVGGTEVAAGAAVLIPPEDEAEMAIAVDRLLADPTLRASLAKAAAERAQGLSLERSLALTRRVWGDLYQGSRQQ